MSPYLPPGTLADDRARNGQNQESEPGKGSDDLASYLFTTAASRLSMEPFAADRGLCFCCSSAAMALDTPCPYAGSALEQLPI
jgi:hypothetical protein